MKKILAIMLCLLMMLSMVALVSCGDDEDATSTSTSGTSSSSGTSGSSDNRPTVDTVGGKTAQELYDAALEKLQSLTNYTVTANAVTYMNMQGQRVPMNVVTVSKINGQDMYVNLENDMYSSLNQTCWYVNEWFYVIQDGISAKANITYEKFISDYAPAGSTSEGALLSFPADWFKDIKFYQDGESYYIELIMSSEEYLEYVGDAANANATAAEDITYKVYFDENGELANIVTEFDFTVEGAFCELVSTMVVTDIGTTVVEAPNGDFIDVTDNMQ